MYCFHAKKIKYSDDVGVSTSCEMQQNFTPAMSAVPVTCAIQLPVSTAASTYYYNVSPQVPYQSAVTDPFWQMYNYVNLPSYNTQHVQATPYVMYNNVNTHGSACQEPNPVNPPLPSTPYRLPPLPDSPPPK